MGWGSYEVIAERARHGPVARLMEQRSLEREQDRAEERARTRTRNREPNPYELDANGKRIFTEAHRQAISDGKKGMVFTDAHRKALSEARKGKRHSPETIAKMKETHRRKAQERRERERVLRLAQRAAEAQAHA